MTFEERLRARRAQIRAQLEGVDVTLLESSPVLGGLASSFDVQGVRIERYYHFICKGDDELVQGIGKARDIVVHDMNAR